ncbi:MAG: tail fiber assembly protein [Plesiomonas sp.]
MKYIFSAKNNAFFPKAMLDEYTSSGWDLDDAISVPDEMFIEFSGMHPDGKTRGGDSAGMPVWIEMPPPTKEQLIQIADGEKQGLLTNAQRSISLWQTQLQLGMISDTDKASLIAWMNYITALQAVDTSIAPDINWPQQPAE